MTSTVLFGDSMFKGFNEYLIRLSDTSVIVKSGLKVSTINDTHVEEIKALKPARVILAVGANDMCPRQQDIVLQPSIAHTDASLASLAKATLAMLIMSLASPLRDAGFEVLLLW